MLLPVLVRHHHRPISRHLLAPFVRLLLPDRMIQLVLPGTSLATSCFLILVILLPLLCVCSGLSAQRARQRKLWLALLTSQGVFSSLPVDWDFENDALLDRFLAAYVSVGTVEEELQRKNDGAAREIQQWYRRQRMRRRTKARLSRSLQTLSHPVSVPNPDMHVGMKDQQPLASATRPLPHEYEPSKSSPSEQQFPAHESVVSSSSSSSSSSLKDNDSTAKASTLRSSISSFTERDEGLPASHLSPPPSITDSSRARQSASAPSSDVMRLGSSSSASLHPRPSSSITQYLHALSSSSAATAASAPSTSTVDMQKQQQQHQLNDSGSGTSTAPASSSSSSSLSSSSSSSSSPSSSSSSSSNSSYATASRIEASLPVLQGKSLTHEISGLKISTETADAASTCESITSAELGLLSLPCSSILFLDSFTCFPILFFFSVSSQMLCLKVRLLLLLISLLPLHFLPPLLLRRHPQPPLVNTKIRAQKYSFRIPKRMVVVVCFVFCCLHSFLMIVDSLGSMLIICPARYPLLTSTLFLCVDQRGQPPQILLHQDPARAMQPAHAWLLSFVF